MPSRPPPLNLGPCHARSPRGSRSLRLGLEVTFSPEASRWVRQQEDQPPGEAAGAPRPVDLAQWEQRGGPGGSRPVLLAEHPFWALWCPEELQDTEPW